MCVVHNFILEKERSVFKTWPYLLSCPEWLQSWSDYCVLCILQLIEIKSMNTLISTRQCPWHLSTRKSDLNNHRPLTTNDLNRRPMMISETTRDCRPPQCHEIDHRRRTLMIISKSFNNRRLYTVFQKNSHFVFFGQNFGKWTPIFTFLSLWDSTGHFL